MLSVLPQKKNSLWIQRPIQRAFISLLFRAKLAGKPTAVKDTHHSKNQTRHTASKSPGVRPGKIAMQTIDHHDQRKDQNDNNKNLM
jgi:hypothetical protein